MATEISSSHTTVGGHSVPEVRENPEVGRGTKDGLPEEFKRQIGENKNVPWYKKDLGEIDKQAHELLEKYSRIPADDIDRHILDLVSSTAVHPKSIWAFPSKERPDFPRLNSFQRDKI